MEVNWKCLICGNGSGNSASFSSETSIPLNKYAGMLSRDTDEARIVFKEGELPCEGCSSKISKIMEGNEKIQEIVREFEEEEGNIQRCIERVMEAGELVKKEMKDLGLRLGRRDSSASQSLTDGFIMLRKLNWKACEKLNKKLIKLEQAKGLLEFSPGEARSILISEFAAAEFEAGEVFLHRVEIPEEADAEAVSDEPVIANVTVAEQVKMTRQGPVVVKKEVTDEEALATLLQCRPTPSSVTVDIPVVRLEDNGKETVELSSSKATENLEKQESTSSPTQPAPKMARSKAMTLPSAESNEAIKRKNILSGDTANKIALLRIFKQLCLEDKKSFRLVCKDWEEASIQYWRDTAVLKILLSQEKAEDEIGITLKAFLKLLQGPAGPYRFPEKPFVNFYLRMDYIKRPDHMFSCGPGRSPSSEDRRDSSKSMRYYSEYETHTRRLLDKCGGSMKYLKLENSPFFSKNRSVDGLKLILLKACVNLKELSFDFWWPEKSKALPLRLKKTLAQGQSSTLETLELSEFFGPSYFHDARSGRDFLDIIPNLKNLYVKDRFGHGFLPFLKLPLLNGNYIMLDRLKVDQQKSRVNLKIRSSPVDGYLYYLLQYVRVAHPPLREISLQLDLQMIREKEPKSSLKPFLEACKDTLTTLNIVLLEYSNQGYTTEWIDDLNGLSLPNLTNLTVHTDYKCGKGYERGFPRYFDFKALQGFPKLQKLSIRLHGYGMTETERKIKRWFRPYQLVKDMEYLPLQDRDNPLIFNEMMRLDKLEEFTFWAYQKFNTGCLIKLSKWMPSIRSLTIDADETTIPVILGEFSSLEKLNLISGSAADEGHLSQMSEVFAGIKIETLNYEQSNRKCSIPDWYEG